MELEMNQSTTGKKINKWLASVDWLELVYLVLFTAFVMKKYLESTVLEWELPSWYDTVVRGGIHAYILVRIYEQAVVKKSMKWKEIALMAVMIFTGEMVTLYTGEIFISDTLLFIIGAKGVDFKKICFVYLCIAISIQLVALYLVNGGYVPDYTYGSGDRVRHSLGICYPTDFAAHMFFIMVVYVCVRGKRLTFAELSIWCALGFEIFKITNARNNFICMILLCILLAIYKVIVHFQIHIHRQKIMQMASYCVVPVSLVCILAMVFYNSSSAVWNRIDNLFTSRLSLSHKAFEMYGIKFFGQGVEEFGGGFGGHQWLGEYFFLDSSYVRLLLKYGILLFVIVCIIIICSLKKAQKCHMGYVALCFIVIVVYGIVEHHMFELAFNPLILFLFAGTYNMGREV